jgi:hypothetical protein
MHIYNIGIISILWSKTQKDSSYTADSCLYIKHCYQQTQRTGKLIINEQQSCQGEVKLLTILSTRQMSFLQSYGQQY